MSDQITRRDTLRRVGAMGLAGGAGALGVAGCSNASGDAPRVYTIDDLNLDTPEARSETIVKVMGSVAEEDTHAFLKFHTYGYTGEGNIVPFFSMNNYVVQKWKPAEPGSFELQHYEVGYYTKFDTDEPMSHWENPHTGESIELFNFVLGPISRFYTPEGIIAPGIAPNPLNISVMGDRVFIPAQSIESFPNVVSPEEFPEYSSGEDTFWDSMYTYSAKVADVLNPDLGSAPAEIHMQNLVSWQLFMKMGSIPGRTMSRAFGLNVSGFDALSPKIRAGFEKYTPEIFETDTWTEMRLDALDFVNKLRAEKGGE